MFVFFFSEDARIEPKALGMLSKCSMAELHFQSLKQWIVLDDYKLLINFIFLEWILLVIFLSDDDMDK